MQEHVRAQYIGVLYLLKKHNYFDFFSVIEKEHAEISYHKSQSIRINSLACCRKVKDSEGDDYPLYVLCEVMESTNDWTKRLCLGPDD